MKYNNCLNINSPLFSRLLNGLENKQSFHFYVQKVSPGYTIITRKKIERWKIIKDDDGELYIGYLQAHEDTYVKSRIYVVTDNKGPSYPILEQPKYNNIFYLKGKL